VLGAGDHTLTATFISSDAVNYTTATTDVSLTVTPAPLTIRADNQSMVHGAAFPTLTASYSGLVNGDTPASLTTAPALATSATSSSPVGGYAVTVGGAVDPNYTITYVAGTLTINPGPNVSGQVKATGSGLVYNRATGLFGGTLTLTNPGSTALTGPLVVELTGLPAGVTLANASGYTADGTPYLLVNLPNNTLAPGSSITFGVQFRNPSKVSLSDAIGTYLE
jgi:hypothetical protein